MSSVFLTSKLLPAPHGFSTRHGGVSVKPYDSMNLGEGGGDVPGAVEQNYARLARAAGLALEGLATVHQVHGNRVQRVSARPPGAARCVGEADALWTEEPGIWVGVRTADCVPVLIVDPERRRVAAIHSGWRGTRGRIVREAVAALVAEGSCAHSLLVAVGPAIGPCCYRVSEELALEFTRAFGGQVVLRASGEAGVSLDLPLAVRDTLLASGVAGSHIDVMRRCTACEPETFYSYRRDGSDAGRHLCFVGSGA